MGKGWMKLRRKTKSNRKLKKENLAKNKYITKLCNFGK